MAQEPGFLPSTEQAGIEIQILDFNPAQPQPLWVTEERSSEWELSASVSFKQNENK